MWLDVRSICLTTGNVCSDSQSVNPPVCLPGAMSASHQNVFVFLKCKPIKKICVYSGFY